MEDKLKYVVAVVGMCFTYLYGTWDTALQVLIGMMVLDYITGLAKGRYQNKLNSKIGLIGIARKSLILIVLMVGVMLDRLINNGTWVFRSLVAYFYIANEGLSIIENVSVLGVPIPEKLKNALEQLNNKEDK